MDEVVVSQFLAANAAKILGVDPEALWCRRVFAPVLATLEQHKDTHQRITRALLREKHIAGDQLAALLQPVTENTRGTTHV